MIITLDSDGGHMFELDSTKALNEPPNKRNGNLIVRNAESSDIESGVLLGRELHAGATIDVMPVDREKIERLARGWLTSRSYTVMVAEEASVTQHDTWPASLEEARMRRIEDTVGFFVGHRYRNPNSSDWLASDISMFVRDNDRGHLAAARLIFQFIEWARETGCTEVCLGSASGFIVEKAGLDHKWLGLERLGPYFRARF
ncbi:MAG: hypothetical protein O3A21_09845 [Proteobacteria bacterium]|nr:hypothetical protein [Pseudomonadota bacterium]